MSEIEDVYPYLDEDGDLLFEQVRFEGKKFAFRRRTKKGGLVWGLGDVRRVPYNLPKVIKAGVVFVVEGEKDVETLRKLGLVATCNPGGAGKWKDEYSKFLQDKKVYVLQDADEAGHKHAKHVAGSVAPYAAEVRLVPPFPKAKDVTEWIEHGGTKKKLEKLVANTGPFDPESAPTDGSTSNDASEQTPDDWRLRPIRSMWVVRLAERLFHDYLILPNGVPFVAALWVIGTYIFKTFDSFPYLTVTSPTKRCGKTRFAEIIELLCSRPLMSVNVSEAALFRSINSDHPPTVIIDEAEALRNRKSERSQYLLPILQSGFREGAYVLRCVGREHEVKKFSVYSPKVVLAIGNLPDTLMDRSVVISMRRHLKSEFVARFRRRLAAQQASGVVSAIALWAEQNKDRIAKAYLKQNLEFLRDREADIWEPLFAIASVAVPERLDELKQIALRLSGEKSALDVDETQGLRLLADVRTIFRTTNRKAITTADLIKKLKGLLDSHWGEDLTPISLSKMLRLFGVSPRQLWIDDSNYRGYTLEDFKLVFERYLPPEPARATRTSGNTGD